MPNPFSSLLQGASNAAASNVSAPVDGLAWLLRKAGLPIPPNPVGGSDWMTKQGLMREPENRNAGLLGEAAGLTSPLFAAAKAPQIANAIRQAAENYAASQTTGRMPMAGQRGAVVWHGSPHKFDKFDASKIGTGEGAQAYGHGLYLADSPGVAKSYQYSSPVAEFNGVSLDLGGLHHSHQSLVNEIHTLASRRNAHGMPMPEATIEAMNSYLAAAKNNIIKQPQSSHHAVLNEQNKFVIEAIEDMIAGKFRFKESSLYKVDLPDEKIARMLDWDKPLSQQAPSVQNAFPLTIDGAGEMGRQAREFRKQADLLYETDPVAALALHKKATSIDTRRGAIGQGDAPGSDLYRTLMDKRPAEAADMLRQLGIPGIRYLDGGSRSAGAGSSNYVVFPGEENALQILARNNQPIR